MQSFNFSKQSDELFFIEGELTFSSITKKTIPSFDFLKQPKDVCINFKKITSADSAALALALEWIKHSKQYNTKLVFKNIPHQLLTLATLSGLELDEYITDVS